MPNNKNNPLPESENPCFAEIPLSCLCPEQDSNLHVVANTGP